MIHANSNKRMTTIASKVTVDQYRMILQCAGSKGISVSEYIRQSLLSGKESEISLRHWNALMAEICSLRTILAYAVTNLATGRRVDAAFMKDLFAEADAMKARDAELRLAQARLLWPLED